LPARQHYLLRRAWCQDRYNLGVLIDTHNHLYYDKFDADREAVLARMAASGVRGAVVIGTELDSWYKSRDLARQHQHLRYAVGLHPGSDFHGFTGGAMARYIGEELGVMFDDALPPVAVGECGIDLHWKADDPQVTWKVNPLDEQQHVFELHLTNALRLDKAVIVHTRDADAETLECLLKFPGSRGVLHCFNGSPELLQFALDRPGWYVGFAGNVTYPKALELQAAAREIPLSKLLVETDAPYMPPVPHRGERNEPGFVRHTAEFIAGLRGITLEDLAAATTANAEELFRTKWG
jgi:TatD DNase family protein